MLRARAQASDGAGDHLQLLFTPGDVVAGEVGVAWPGKKPLEYISARVELIGQIEYVYDKKYVEFTSLVRELDGPGELTQRGKVREAACRVARPRGAWAARACALTRTPALAGVAV